MFRKLNTSTQHDLEFLMLFKGNSFQNFFCKNTQKVHMLFVYSKKKAGKKNQWQKSEKKKKKSYLPIISYFLEVYI